MDTLNDFLETNTGKLWKELKKELPTGSDPNSQEILKQYAAYADSVQMDVAVWLRRLSIHLDTISAECSSDYIDYCNDNDIKPTETGRDRYVKERTIKERAWKTELENLQTILKNRVILAQSLLRSVKQENTTTAVGYDISKLNGLN